MKRYSHKKRIISFENFNKARLLGIVLRTAKTLSNLMLFLMVHGK